MKKLFKNILLAFDDTLFRWLVKFLYPKYKRSRKGYQYNYVVLKRYFFFQKILRINGNVPWPVHFTSRVIGVEHIEKGICSDPGDNAGVYINAYGGLKIGSNVSFGHNTSVTTTNHDMYNHKLLSKVKGIEIGDNVWIGANCSILAGTKIGNNVTIGAGCVISGIIKDDMVVVQDKNNLRFVPKRKAYEWDCTKEQMI